MLFNPLLTLERASGEAGCVLEPASASMSKSGNGVASPANKLYFGNNFDWLQLIEPDSVDLVYLDPPFNSKAQYNLLYETPDNERETAQRTVFRDTWT